MNKLSFEDVAKVALAVIKNYWLMCPSNQEAELVANKIIKEIFEEEVK